MMGIKHTFFTKEIRIKEIHGGSLMWRLNGIKMDPLFPKLKIKR
jgi:hypothetical protein